MVIILDYYSPMLQGGPFYSCIARVLFGRKSIFYSFLQEPEDWLDINFHPMKNKSGSLA
jgi:hypothetical protein